MKDPQKEKIKEIAKLLKKVSNNFEKCSMHSDISIRIKYEGDITSWEGRIAPVIVLDKKMSMIERKCFIREFRCDNLNELLDLMLAFAIEQDKVLEKGKWYK